MFFVQIRWRPRLRVNISHQKNTYTEDAEDENTNSTEDLRPTISYKMNIYEDWKLICDAYQQLVYLSKWDRHSSKCKKIIYDYDIRAEI